MDYFILPIVTAQPTYVRDTADLLRKLEESTFPPDTCILITSIDVVSMYTNVCQTEAINRVCNALNCKTHPYSITKPPSNYIRKLLELILGRNCFHFGNNYYLQKIGCAMGSTASPEICDITLHDLENQILKQADHILTWWRYRDDILVIYNSTLENFKSLINTMNKIFSSLCRPVLEYGSPVWLPHQKNTSSVLKLFNVASQNHAFHITLILYFLMKNA